MFTVESARASYACTLSNKRLLDLCPSTAGWSEVGRTLYCSAGIVVGSVTIHKRLDRLLLVGFCSCKKVGVTYGRSLEAGGNYSCSASSSWLGRSAYHRFVL